jgi:hypothetical protein
MVIHLESDGNGALKYTRELSFPRRTGTEGERKAAQAIVRTLKGLGYETVEEEFWILAPPWVWMKGSHLLTIFFLLTIWLTYEKIPFIAFLRPFIPGGGSGIDLDSIGGDCSGGLRRN